LNNLKVRSNVITVDYGKDSNDFICCLLIYVQTAKKTDGVPPLTKEGEFLLM
jgi:hypothetical protein